jgi:hypothetical protein
MLSHGNLLHNVESCRIVLQTVPDDRFAVLLPLFHSYMLTVGLFLPLLVGGSMVLVKSLHPRAHVAGDFLAPSDDSAGRAAVLPHAAQRADSDVPCPSAFVSAAPRRCRCRC